MSETRYPTYAETENARQREMEAQMKACAELDYENAQFGGTAAPKRVPAAMEQFKRLEDAAMSVAMATEQLEARLGYVLRSPAPKETGEKNAQPVSDAPIVQSIAGVAEHLYAQAARLRDLLGRLEV